MVALPSHIRAQQHLRVADPLPPEAVVPPLRLAFKDGQPVLRLIAPAIKPPPLPEYAYTPLPDGIADLAALYTWRDPATGQPHPDREAWLVDNRPLILHNDEVRRSRKRVEESAESILAFAEHYFPDTFREPFSDFHRELIDFVFEMPPHRWYVTEVDPETGEVRYKVDPQTGAYVKRRGVVAAAPRGHGKCGSERHTFVSMANGTRKRLGDLRVGDRILSLNQETLRFERDTIVAKERTGRKRILRAVTRSGRALYLTPEHRVLTFDGWKTMGDLSLSDRIAAPRRAAPEAWAVDHSDAEVKLLAYLLAEGSTANGSCCFTNADAPVIADFQSCARELGFSWREVPQNYAFHLRSETDSPRDFLRRHSLWGKKSTEKRLPEWVFGLPERQKWLFLGAFMVTDGWFAREAGQGGITLASQGLIDDLIHLCEHLGLLVTRGYRENDHAGAWELRFGGAGVRALLDHCDLMQKRDAAEAICSRPRYSLVDTYPETVKRHKQHGTEWYRDHGCRIDGHYDTTREKLRRLLALESNDEWQRLEDAEVFWDRVVSIEDWGEDDTCDVQVARNQNLITNGLVTHNSTILTFLLPIYCAVFRIKHFVLILSDSDDQVRTFCAEIKKQIEENELLRRDFGEMVGLRYGLRWTGEDFSIAHVSFDAEGKRTIDHECRIAGRSINARLRGLKAGSYRPDFIIADDVENDDRVQSRDQRNKLNIKLNRAVMPMLDPQTGSFFFCGTIMHFDSLLNRLLGPSLADSYVQHVWRCIKEGADSIFDAHAEPLWPEKFPLHVLREVRASMTEGEFATEWMNDPRDPENRDFLPEWFRWFHRRTHLRRNGKTGEYEFWRPDLIDPLTGEGRWQRLLIYQAVDPAISQSDRADYFTMVTVGIAEETRDAVILNLVRDRLNFPDQVRTVFGQFLTYPMALGCGIETVQYQESLYQTILGRRKEDARLPRVPVKRVKYRTGDPSKEVRLRRRAWDVETGSVWFPRLLPGDAGFAEAPLSEADLAGQQMRVPPRVYPLYQEMVEFPKSAHDDCLDALDMALTVAGKRAGLGEWQRRRSAERRGDEEAARTLTPALDEAGNAGVAATGPARRADPPRRGRASRAGRAGVGRTSRSGEAA